MKIHQAERLTGLSQKAIRLYESKGLLAVSREENGYRSYTEEDVATLSKIKLLRLAGISLSDIKLYLVGLISADDLLSKRKKQIASEHGTHSRQYAVCEQIASDFSANAFGKKYAFEEENDHPAKPCGRLAVGIDIGTTTISAALIDLDEKRQVASYTIPNRCNVEGREPFFAEQDAEAIIEKAIRLLDHVLDEFSSVSVIGVTGQMHGIVYVDGQGKAISPLATWRDERAGQMATSGLRYTDEMQSKTGEHVAVGYGLATHYYNLQNGTVPEDAASLCSVMDLLVLRLSGRKTPLVHSSVAASFGLFDLENASFCKAKLAALGIDAKLLPVVTDDYAICGRFRDIPVSVAIGDNQASFLGSVKKPEKSILLNVGTGSQISFMGELCALPEGLELRPLVKGKHLICGAALCGGSAYALLERFFREYLSACGLAHGSQYEILNRLAAEAYEKNACVPTVKTTFRGTRTEPDRTGALLSLREESFTPGALALGFIQGICEELFDFYRASGKTDKSYVVASGGGSQRIGVLPKVAKDIFAMPVALLDGNEEASVGAALFAAVSDGLLSGMSEFSDYIRYADKKQ